MPKPKRLSKSFYDKAYFTKAGSPKKGKYGRIAFALENPFHVRMASLVTEILPIEKGQSLLDIGCALGNVIYWLNYEGIKAYGVDISEYAVKHTHSQGKVKQQDIIDGLPYKSNRFDFIYTRETLEHVHEHFMLGILKEMWRVLRPGGMGLISTRNNFGNKETIKQSNPHSADRSHLCVRHPWWWTEMLEEVGFKVDYKRTLYAMCLPMCEEFTWTMIVVKKAL